MKWYNVEIPYNTRNAIARADNFKMWMDENVFKYETSAAGYMVHFEICANENDLPKINKALDEIVWYDAIFNITD